jgi:hypothetical protein
MNNADGTMHMVLKLTGESFSKDLFHTIVKEIDSDYPLDPSRKIGDKIEICKRCRGVVWRNPSVLPEALKRLALQCGIKIKVKSWLASKKCGGPTIDLPYYE